SSHRGVAEQRVPGRVGRVHLDRVLAAIAELGAARGLTIPGEGVGAGISGPLAAPHRIAGGILDLDRDVGSGRGERVAEGRRAVGELRRVRLRLDGVADVVDRVERHEARERVRERRHAGVGRLLFGEVGVGGELVDEVGRAGGVQRILVLQLADEQVEEIGRAHPHRRARRRTRRARGGGGCSRGCRGNGHDKALFAAG
ncbi:hypothetical protein chiPu_0031553, partial [Chiloscyllium punctatum]|nr:hypothetical protein [Chiloscyllium punctatum]